MRILICLLINLCAVGSRLGAQPYPIILPGGTENRNGNSFTFAPFAIGDSSMRYQQVFTPVGIPHIDGADAFWISAMMIRPDEAAFTTLAADMDLQINLSTTSRGPDGLSTVFADNTGTDETVVFPRTWWRMVASPGTYSTITEFAQPFYYDTRAGNLLVDVRYFGGGGETTILDAVNVSNDDTSRVWANSVNANSGTADSLGLVFGFYVTPIPEPTSLTLLFCGVAVFGLVFRRQIRSKE